MPAYSGPKPQSRNLRRGRHSEPSRIYLVTFVCRKRQRLFCDLSSGRCVVHAMRELARIVDTLCFVIMPDHVHWLLQLREQCELAGAVRCSAASL